MSLFMTKLMFSVNTLLSEQTRMGRLLFLLSTNLFSDRGTQNSGDGRIRQVRERIENSNKHSSPHMRVLSFCISTLSMVHPGSMIPLWV